MRRFLSPLLLAVPLLLLAYISGYAVTSRLNVDLSGHLEVFSSGLREVRTFLADLLYLQLDRYHHILLYQGYDWKVVTDYLPQLWLVTRLDPSFGEAYADGGYHLAINLGHVEDGIELLLMGMENCPDDPDVSWEYAYVTWKTGSLSRREQVESVWSYLRLERRLDMSASVIERYTNAMNACRLLWWTFEDYAGRADNTRIAERYRRRVDVMLRIRAMVREASSATQA
jgi:hypothetical protein